MNSDNKTHHGVKAAGKEMQRRKLDVRNLQKRCTARVQLPLIFKFLQCHELRQKKKNDLEVISELGERQQTWFSMTGFCIISLKCLNNCQSIHHLSSSAFLTSGCKVHFHTASFSFYMSSFGMAMHHITSRHIYIQHLGFFCCCDDFITNEIIFNVCQCALKCLAC